MSSLGRTGVRNPSLPHPDASPMGAHSLLLSTQGISGCSVRLSREAVERRLPRSCEDGERDVFFVFFGKTIF